MEPVTSLLRWRVVKTFNAGNSEITPDLPTLHQAHIEVVAFQPGNPGSSALGSFTIKLHPPGSPGYAAAKAIYDQLDYFNRVEGYISADGASLGKLYYAGIVTQIRKSYGENSTFELSGHSDIVLVNLSRPFPGEVSGPNSITTTAFAKAYFGTNEAGALDNFTPYVSGNYTSSLIPGAGSGTWSSTTDDGLNVVACSTGAGATLISKTGAAAGDTLHNQYVEISGRLNTNSTSAAGNGAGQVGIGLSKSNANCNDCYVVSVQAVWNSSTSNYDLQVNYNVYAGGVNTVTRSSSTILTSAADAGGHNIAYTIGISFNTNQAQATVNGLVAFTPTGLPAFDPGTATLYPFLVFGVPATGSATGYFTNLVQEVRYTADANPTTAAFIPGTIGTATQSFSSGVLSQPTFLENWTRAATRESWYWRYTPQAYVVGTRTLGTVDLTSDPGTDYGTNQTVVFSQALGNLVNIELTANADQFVSQSTVSSVPGNDGGGLAYWRDVSSTIKYGVFEDQVLNLVPPSFAEQRLAARSVMSNRINIGTAGSKTAIVLRDPQTADKWREIDKVMIHCPEIGLNYAVARVVAYTFDEGQPTQTLTLDQLSIDDPTLLSKRLQTGVWQIANRFSTR